MANRCTLHKTKLGDFKLFLNSKGIAYRKGKGEYQALQVLTKNNGWQCVHIKNEMPEHFSVQDKLMPLVRDFLNDDKTHQSAEIGKEWVEKEYAGEDVDKWVFTRTDIEEAFKAGMEDYRDKILPPLVMIQDQLNDRKSFMMLGVQMIPQIARAFDMLIKRIKT